jgi:hypothetical protein
MISKLNNRTTVVILGELYEHLGRSDGETVQLLLKLLKNGDSQMRCEVLLTFKHIINGLDSIGRNIHREIFKIARTHMYDRAMSVRSAAATVLFYSCRITEENLFLGFSVLLLLLITINLCIQMNWKGI